MDDTINLDIHAISELKSKGLPPTSDLPKYNYKANESGKYCKNHAAALDLIPIPI